MEFSDELRHARISINQLCLILQIGRATAYRWVLEDTAPLAARLVVRSIRTGLPVLKNRKLWKGWRFVGDDLISPEGWRFTEGEIREFYVRRFWGQFRERA
jgi:hypothetical protein